MAVEHLRDAGGPSGDPPSLVRPLRADPGVVPGVLLPLRGSEGIPAGRPGKPSCEAPPLPWLQPGLLAETLFGWKK